ncbi:hypothetical protein AAG570_006551 [Ranatra chinensis]|uniref:BESS domain-containing protein n=1 Tax=Ranatra chinensis TaxID=642074 RepID=A0ABD0YUC5_9HEMI
MMIAQNGSDQRTKSKRRQIMTLCREKWANLRSNFARELRKARRKVAELPSALPMHQPHSQWVFYEAMSFLAPFVKSRLATFDSMYDPDDPPTGAACVVKLEEEGTSSSCGEGESSGGATGEDKWGRLWTAGGARAAADYLEVLEEDDDRLFLLSLLPKMRHLSMQDNIKFRIEVQALLLEKLASSAQNNPPYNPQVGGTTANPTESEEETQ